MVVRGEGMLIYRSLYVLFEGLILSKSFHGFLWWRVLFAFESAGESVIE